MNVRCLQKDGTIWKNDPVAPTLVGCLAIEPSNNPCACLAIIQNTTRWGGPWRFRSFYISAAKRRNRADKRADRVRVPPPVENRSCSRPLTDFAWRTHAIAILNLLRMTSLVQGTAACSILAAARDGNRGRGQQRCFAEWTLIFCLSILFNFSWFNSKRIYFTEMNWFFILIFSSGKLRLINPSK